MDDRKEAIHQAAEALDLLNRYHVTASHTARVRYETTIYAVDMEQAVEMAKEADYWGNQVFQYDGDDEGDRTIDIYLPDPVTEAQLDEADTWVDCRKDGEPYSWTAVKIVKELAKIDEIITNWKFAEFIKRAKAACSKEEV